MTAIRTQVFLTAPADARDPYPVPLTVPELRHLLAQLLWLPPHSIRLVLAWSWWRRCHQGRARSSHTKRRLEAG